MLPGRGPAGPVCWARMRLQDVGDSLRLRGLVENPWEVMRARKQREGDTWARFRDGRRLRLRGGHTDFHIFHRIFVQDEYRLARADGWDTVVDIGANVGCFAFRVAPRARRVVAVEPEPGNFAALRANLEGLANVDLVREAVADAPGELSLYRDAHGTQGGRFTLYRELDPGFLSDTVTVPVTTLDALFARHGVERCDLLKLDAEGAEYDVLYGASPGTLARVGAIAGEYHDVRPEDPRTRVEAFRAFLADQGFGVEVLPGRRHANTGLFFATR